jgi:hypothetical protein
VVRPLINVDLWQDLDAQAGPHKLHGKRINGNSESLITIQSTNIGDCKHEVRKYYHRRDL